MEESQPSAAAVPPMVHALASGPDAESDKAHRDQAYAALTLGDFSRQVLSVATEQLAVLSLGDVGWSDLGTPERVRSAIARFGMRTDRRMLAPAGEFEVALKAGASG